MPPLLALSTSWCSHRHSDGHALLAEIAGLGFDHVELSHGIRITLVPGILRAVEQGLIRVSSTHNFCPLPTGVNHAAPNLYEPSSPDPREQDQWVRHTRRSLEFAAQVGARALVCHLGQVRFRWWNPAARARRAAARAFARGSAADLARSQADAAVVLRKVNARAAPYWERVRTNLATVAAFAAEKQVRLGLENRERLEELPLDAEWAGVLQGLPEAAVGYWHDTGHARLKQALGVLDPIPHLETLAARTIGFHLHDVQGGRDHQAIGRGDIDFAGLSRFFQPEHVLTLEFGPHVTADEVRDSKRRIEALLRG